MPGFEFDIVNTVTTTIDEDGFELVQHDADGEQGSPPYEVHHPFGSWGRPADGVGDGSGVQVDPAQSGNLLTLTEGGVGHAMHLADPRVTPNVPAPAAGEHVTYSSSGCFTRHHLDGSVSVATTTEGGDASGQTVAQRVTPSSFERFAPWGRETFDAMSWRLAHVGGTKITAGYVSGPGPLAGGQSFFRAQAQIVEINGSMVSIGPSGVDCEPVAKAQPLVTVLTSLMTAIQGLTAAIGAITAGSTNGGAAALTATNAVVLVQQAQADVSSALESIATQSAIG